MSSLDSLMNLQGAAAAFEYSDRGELTDHRISEQSNLTADALDLLAHVFVANICIATMQARGWEKTTGQGGFYPVQGFTLVGLEWSAVFLVGCAEGYHQGQSRDGLVPNVFDPEQTKFGIIPAGRRAGDYLRSMTG